MLSINRVWSTEIMAIFTIWRVTIYLSSYVKHQSSLKYGDYGNFHYVRPLNSNIGNAFPTYSGRSVPRGPQVLVSPSWHDAEEPRVHLRLARLNQSKTRLLFCSLTVKSAVETSTLRSLNGMGTNTTEMKTWSSTKIHPSTLLPLTQASMAHGQKLSSCWNLCSLNIAKTKHRSGKTSSLSFSREIRKQTEPRIKNLVCGFMYLSPTLLDNWTDGNTAQTWEFFAIISCFNFFIH